MPHDSEKRREAGVAPIVLFSERGRTVESYTPIEDELTSAEEGLPRHEWVPVQGPHLRAVRSKDRRSKTGIVGISLSRCKANGRHYLVVNLGPTNRRFCVETLGNTEAWRRAIALRHAHLEKLALANAAIIAARMRAAERRAS